MKEKNKFFKEKSQNSNFHSEVNTSCSSTSAVNNLNLNPMDVALIKVYPPPAQLVSLTNGGAVAIYTKRGAYENQKGAPQYNFMVKGYTQGLSRLKGRD